MAIEHAGMRVVDKPWGSTDLRPWSDIRHDGVAIGELWFQRADRTRPIRRFFSNCCSRRSRCRSRFIPTTPSRNRSAWRTARREAWYVLSATPGAKVAIGLKRRLTAAQLRASIEDGSIADLVQWREVLKDDVIFVPAGTIHAIGAGLVIAEIQQRSDATFRLFDYGRAAGASRGQCRGGRECGAGRAPIRPKAPDRCRTLLVASPHFVLSGSIFAPKSNWELHAEHRDLGPRPRGSRADRADERVRRRSGLPRGGGASIKVGR